MQKVNGQVSLKNYYALIWVMILVMKYRRNHLIPNLLMLLLESEELSDESEETSDDDINFSDVISDEDEDDEDEDGRR